MFFIEEKNKCINNCKNDNKYKYLYNGICYEECPNNLNSRDYPKYNGRYLSNKNYNKSKSFYFDETN